MHQHVLADAKLRRHRRAERLDRAAQLVAGDPRVAHQRIHAAKRAQVGAAEADGADAQQHVALADRRLGDVDERGFTRCR